MEAKVDAVGAVKEHQVGEDELLVEAVVVEGVGEGVVISSQKMIWGKEW